MLPIPTKIRAIRADPKDPQMDLYSKTDVATLAALAVQKVFANNPIPTKSTKESSTMSFNYTAVVGLDGNAPKVAKRHVPGIAAGSPARLVETLVRLGLCPSNLIDPLTTLAAHGKPLDAYFTVSIDSLDMALSNVECSTENRIRFKQSLVAAGLLKTKR
jgi:hypothetical protein